MNQQKIAYTVIANSAQYGIIIIIVIIWNKVEGIFEYILLEK